MLFVIGRGRITFVDDSGPVQLVQINLGSTDYPQLVDRVPNVQNFGFTGNPPIGSDTAAGFVAGDRANGVVLGTNNQTWRVRNLASGEVAVYDAQGRYIKLTAAGITVEAAGAPVIVQDASTISATASTSITLTVGGSSIQITPSGVAITGAAIQNSGPVTMSSTLSVAGSILDATGTGNTDTVGQLRAAYDAHKHPVTGVQTGTGSVVSGTTDHPV